MKLNIVAQETIEPKCRHFRVCGGCQFQHVPYDEQLAQKRAFVSHCFDQQADPIVPCDPAWRYRNKMEFSFSQSRQGDTFLGLMRRKGRVENLEECHLTNPWFAAALHNVRQWWRESSLRAYHPLSNTGVLRTLTLREGIRTKERMALLTLSEEEFSDKDLEAFVQALPEVDTVVLRRQIIKKKCPTRFEETLVKGSGHIHEILYDERGKPFRFQIKAASFFQPNTLQAEMIYQLAIASAELKPEESVLDLYCGTGSLGIFASSSVSKVLGIEWIPEAVEDARTNCALNAISNVEIWEGDVGKLLADLSFHPSAILIDPPRAGLGPQALGHLLHLKAEKIVYVSCNPATQAADCHHLCQEGGYTLKRLQPIDQFPHTPHIENIALLTRS